MENTTDILDRILNGDIEETDEILSQEEENQYGEDDDGDDKKKSTAENSTKIEPKKRSIRNPRQRLTVEILKGSRGIHTIEDYFKNMKFRGKGYEKEDLNEVMRRLQHWAHRMYSNYNFDDVLANVEKLGKKKEIQLHMTRYRLGQLEEENSLATRLNQEIDFENVNSSQNEEPLDEFDALLNEQIAISKLQKSVNTTTSFQENYKSRNISEKDIASIKPIEVSFLAVSDTPMEIDNNELQQEESSDLVSIPVSTSEKYIPTKEELTRAEENRKRALEKLRLTKLKQAGRVE